jgi:hypothetical protein
MQHRNDPGIAPDRGHERAAFAHEHRQPYVAPALERLGGWSALTLEQSIGVAFLRALFDNGVWWPDEPY